MSLVELVPTRALGKFGSGKWRYRFGGGLRGAYRGACYPELLQHYSPAIPSNFVL